jgi:hypothetical protein
LLSWRNTPENLNYLQNAEKILPIPFRAERDYSGFDAMCDFEVYKKFEFREKLAGFIFC